MAVNKWCQAREALEQTLESLEVAKADAAKKELMRNETNNALEDVRFILTRQPQEDEEVNGDKVGNDPNNRLPSGPADFVEIRYETSRGRFAVANRLGHFHLNNRDLIMFCCRDVPVGTVVLAESPVAAKLKPKFQEGRCDLCFRDCSLRQVPCTGCVTARFCSTACRTTAMGN